MLDKTGKQYKKAGEPDWLAESEGFLDDLFPSEPNYSEQFEERALEGPVNQPQSAQPETPQAAPEPVSVENPEGDGDLFSNLFSEDEEPVELKLGPSPEEEWVRPEWLPQDNYTYSDQEKATLQNAFKTDLFQLPPPDLSKIKNLRTGIKYLNSLGNRAEEVARVVQNAMSLVDKASVDRDNKNVKIAAQAAASASINLHVLSKEANSIFGDQDTVDKVQDAIGKMISYISEEVSSKLSKRGEDIYNKKFDKETMEKVIKRRPLTGQDYPEWYINRDLRTIQIMENQGLTEEKAKDKANKELERADIIIDQHIKNASVEDKKKYKNEFVRQVVAGSSVEDAEEHLINLITKGSNEELFNDVDVKPFIDNDEAIFEKIDVIKDPEGLVTDLVEEGVTDAGTLSAIADKIKDFAKAAYMTMQYIVNIPDVGAEYGSEANIMGRTNLAKAHALFGKLMMTPKEIINNEFAKETFDDIYIVDRILSDYAQNEKYALGGAAEAATAPSGIKTTIKDDEDIKGPEINEQTLQGGTEDTGFQEVGGKPSGSNSTTPKRSKEQRQPYDEDYQRRQRESGAYEKKLERDRAKRESDPDKAAKKREIAKLIGQNFNRNKQEINRWERLSKGRKGEPLNPTVFDQAVRASIESTRKRLASFANNLASSWFDEETKNKYKVTTIAKLIDVLQQFKDNLAKSDTGNDPHINEVIEVINSHIVNIPKMFAEEEAKTTKKEIKIREKDTRAHDILMFSNIFKKYSDTI